MHFLPTGSNNKNGNNVKALDLYHQISITQPCIIIAINLFLCMNLFLLLIQFHNEMKSNVIVIIILLCENKLIFFMLFVHLKLFHFIRFSGEKKKYIFHFLRRKKKRVLKGNLIFLNFYNSFTPNRRENSLH